MMASTVRVLIVRHAIAAERDAEAHPTDDERPLTPKGVRRMREQASGIARLVDRPHALHTSPLVRATDTAKIVGAAWGRPALKAEVVKTLAPGHAPAEVARWLKTLGADQTVVLVGHEPGCSELLSHLLSGGPEVASDFKKGGAALVDLPSARPHARGVLLWFATPRLLRLAAK
jgi:phosphohistidine phosphatase